MTAVTGEDLSDEDLAEASDDAVEDAVDLMSQLSSLPAKQAIIHANTEHFPPKQTIRPPQLKQVCIKILASFHPHMLQEFSLFRID